MLSNLPCSTTMDFELPADCNGAVIVASFDRSLTDQEYIITLSFATNEQFVTLHLPELSWSASLESAFVYVSDLPAGAVYRSPRFEIPKGTRRMQVHCRAWKSHGTGPEQSLNGLAVEVFMAEPALPAHLSRVILPGKES